VDERVGRNVRQLRENAGMSKAKLLKAMQAAGHSWHPVTVVRIEAGTQSLRAAELFDLTVIFGTTLDRFTWTSPEANADALLRQPWQRITDAYDTIATAIPQLLAALGTARQRAGQFVDHPSQQVRDTSEDLLLLVADHGLDAAVAEGISRYEHRGDPR
jgi:transcriptional regulator with XRE-family HTH domain